jgi:hypothetical protein
MGKQQAESRQRAQRGGISVSNRMMAIEPVFVHANEIIPPRLPMQCSRHSKNAMSDALRPSAMPELREIA